MRLGNAIAVIRYNAGYSGIRELFEILQIHSPFFDEDTYSDIVIK